MFNIKKILIISEALCAPFDEGIKNIVFSLYKQFEKRKNVFLVTKEGNKTQNLNVLKTDLNKLFLNIKLKRLLKTCSPDVVLYIPLASCTFNSFVRAKILKLMHKQMKIAVLGVQHRDYSQIQSAVLARFLKPDLVLLLGRMDEPFFLSRGMKVKVLPPAIDIFRFSPANNNEKIKIREKFGIPMDKRVILHVGHIRESRNLEFLFDIQKQNNIQVVVVASSTWGEDIGLRNRLESAGIRIIDGFIPDMSRIYKMSDVYVFPVINKKGATDMPLSVLEAMACNLPVVTTRYGGLVDFFAGDTDFRYFSSRKELLEIVKDIEKNNKVSNYKKIEVFTWERFADEVISACGNL